MKNFIKKKWVKLLLLMGLVILYLLLYKIYIPRINAFGCFDDCFNFMGGYFLLHGKRLFSEIFFNHNPLMAYLSLVVQFLTHPENLYELILRHRQFLLVFSFLFNVLLLFRFGISAFAFALFYELTKFYLFGDRFLAEGFIVYPLIYLVGVAWFKLQNKTITFFDYIAAGVFTWFIVFMREPYVPAALVLFGYLLWNNRLLSFRARSRNLVSQKVKSKTMVGDPVTLVGMAQFLSFGIFFILSIITIFLHDVKEFFFNVVTINSSAIFVDEAKSTGVWGWGLWKLFLYPINLFFGGEWGYFRYITLSLNLLFLISFSIMIIKKQWKLVLFVWIILGFLNIRYLEPGIAFYAAFHLLCWYAVFLFASFLMLSFIYKSNKKLSMLISSLYIGILLFHMTSPLSFLQNKPDPQYELITNYGGPMQIGNVIRSLSEPSDTLFVDGFDEIIYWQSQRFSLYKYSWYTSFMPQYKKYTDARVEMFKQDPPEFYYGSCPKEKKPNFLLPVFIKDNYMRLYSDKNPSCLWVKKSKLKTIKKDQWKEAELHHYNLPQKD